MISGRQDLQPLAGYCNSCLALLKQKYGPRYFSVDVNQMVESEARDDFAELVAAEITYRRFQNPTSGRPVAVLKESKVMREEILGRFTKYRFDKNARQVVFDQDYLDDKVAPEPYDLPRGMPFTDY